MTDIDPDDVKAMRKQGDLGSFLRQQIAAGRTRREPAPAQPPPQPPGRRRPGEWPATAHDVRTCQTCHPGGQT
jgi:hypothetical protein